MKKNVKIFNLLYAKNTIDLFYLRFALKKLFFIAA